MNVEDLNIDPGLRLIVQKEEPNVGPAEEQNYKRFDGPLSGPMWKKVSSLSSGYPDDFDWSVYDRLYRRYGDKQPWLGVVFKKNFRLVNYHSSCVKCHYAFEIDTYGRGCTFNCAYCYAKDQLTSHGTWNRPHPYPLDLSEVRKIFSTVFEGDKRSRWRAILEKRVPLRLGSMSDCFMGMEQNFGITRELLKILRFYKYPYVIFTRSDLVAADDYLKLLDRELAAVQFSICGINPKATQVTEPGAPSVHRRLIALRKLADAGVWTTVRLNPLFPTFPDGYYTDYQSVAGRFGRRDSCPRLEIFEIERLNEFVSLLSEAKVPGLLAGFVRLSPYSVGQLTNALSVDLKSFFKPDLWAQKGDKRYSDSEIAFYYKAVQSECVKQGLRFSTCFIGNGLKDYYQYQEMWSNKQDCCDVRGNVPKFSTSSQDIPWSLREPHAPDKKCLSDTKAQELRLDREFAQRGIAFNLPSPAPNPPLRLINGSRITEVAIKGLGSLD